MVSKRVAPTGTFKIPTKLAKEFSTDLRLVLGENRPDGIMVLPIKVLQDLAAVKDLLKQGEIIFIPHQR